MTKATAPKTTHEGKRSEGESALFYLVRDIFRHPVRGFYSDDAIRFVDAFLFLTCDTFWYEIGGLDKSYFWELLLTEVENE